MTGRDCTVVFAPSGRRGSVPAGTSVLEAARQLAVDLDSVCGGRGLCGRCQIVLAEGNHAKHGITVSANHLSTPGTDEAGYAARRGLMPGRRLGCRARILADVVVDVPADSQVHQQIVRKALESRDVELDPPLHLYLVDLPGATLATAGSDLERLQRALASEWGLTELECPAPALATVQAAARSGQVTVAIRDGEAIVGAWSGFHERAAGLAVDIGSTTIAVHLCDLGSGDVLATAGGMNPQIRFGEDLMSRVSYVMLNRGGRQQLTDAAREAIAQLTATCCARAGVAPGDVLEAVLVANPIMHHLLLGLDPTPLGQAPFTLAIDTAATFPANDVGLGLHAAARAYLLPCIAGHVGADTAAVMLAEEPWNAEVVTLIIDVGTNAELVLADGERMLAASSPTGPAFEGAQISCGRRAAPGAIERVRIDRTTLAPRFKLVGCDIWSDASEFDDATFATGVTGVCGSGIIETIAEMYLSGVLAADGTLGGEDSPRTPYLEADGRTWAYVLHDGPPRLRITQNDVRAIQLAKAALYAGARLLMEHLGVERVQRIRLAGAFGSHIDPRYAMVLGLFPDCDLSQVSSAGNAAGTGARIALLSRRARGEIEGRVREVEKIETAIEPRFQEHFVAAMAFPHACDPFPQLRREMTLPPPPESRRGGRGRRRRH